MKPMPSETLPSPVIPLFLGLLPSAVENVLAQGRIFKVAPKIRLCTEGDRAEHLFVVLRGRVKYSRRTAKGDELILRLFTPGETFGLATLLPNPLNYLGTAEAHFGGVLHVWHHDEISPLSDRYHQIKTNALSIALRLMETLPQAKKPIAPGQEYEGTGNLVRRLQFLGDLSASLTVPENSRSYSGVVVEGVKRFQVRHGLEASGKLGP
jgi:hypothetical protein